MFSRLCMKGGLRNRVEGRVDAVRSFVAPFGVIGMFPIVYTLAVDQGREMLVRVRQDYALDGRATGCDCRLDCGRHGSQRALFVDHPALVEVRESRAVVRLWIPGEDRAERLGEGDQGSTSASVKEVVLELADRGR